MNVTLGLDYLNVLLDVVDQPSLWWKMLEHITPVADSEVLLVVFKVLNGPTAQYLLHVHVPVRTLRAGLKKITTKLFCFKM